MKAVVLSSDQSTNQNNYINCDAIEVNVEEERQWLGLP